MADHNFTNRKVFMRDGVWHRVEDNYGVIPYEQAVERFKKDAQEMEDEFGDSHFWTATLRSESGDYFQVFHQRMVDGYLNY